MDENQNARKQLFKKGTDCESQRRRRADHGVQIRKQKREEGVAKRRNVTVSHSMEPQAPGTPTPPPRRSYTLSEIPTLVQLLTSADPDERLEGARGLRKLLSAETNHPPARRVIDSGALPGLIALLSFTERKEAQFEAAWALTNIASTDLTKEVAGAGAIPPLCAMLMHETADMRDQSAWCLGNIAGDGPQLRDEVIAGGAVAGLLANAAQPATRSLLRNVTWTMSNLCRGRPAPPQALVDQLAPVLAKLLSTDPTGAIAGGDEDVRVDAAWALSYLSDGDDVRINSVVAAGAVPPLVAMLESSATQCVTPALRALGNIVTGDDKPTQAVLDAGVLPTLVRLLKHVRKGVRKEACWMISNIAAGTQKQVDALCRSEGMVAGMVEALASGEHDVQKEAAWAVSNAATGGGAVHVAAIVSAGGLAAIAGMLGARDSKVVSVCLEALEAILKHDATVDGAYAQNLEENDGVTAIEDLQNHENENIYQKAQAIIEKYLGGEEENAENDNAEALVPHKDKNGATFYFGEYASATAVAATPNVFGFGSTANINANTAQPAPLGSFGGGGFDFGGGF